MIHADMEIERNGEMLTITLEGRAEYFGSYNPHERGLQIGDWWATGPDGKMAVLTDEEIYRAIELLENSLQGD